MSEQNSFSIVKDSLVKDSFQCLQSGEHIPNDYINDDYCDCVDGTDEPFTNACPHNRFVNFFIGEAMKE